MADTGLHHEQQFLLRVKDAQLAALLNRALHEETPLPGDLDLEFAGGAGRAGVLTLAGTAYPVAVKDLPTIVESYITKDDVNLVKTGDVGQMLVVNSPGEPEDAPVESIDGLTPPMRNARARHFKPTPQVDPTIIAKVEADLLALLGGSAPEGMEFVDVEEEYVVPEGGHGSWQAINKP